MKIYNRLMDEHKYYLQQFVFQMVIYDEIEYFPKSIKDKHFMYPFENQKHIINKYKLKYNNTQYYDDTFTVKKS